MESIILNKKDFKNLKKYVKKYNYEKVKIGLDLDGKIVYGEGDVNIKDYDVKEETYWFILILNALNIKDKYEKYKYIYYTMCDFLDEYVCSLCSFKCDRCIANNLKKSKHDINGCCYFRNMGLCPYLKDRTCMKKSISCKLFMCDYMENKYKFKCVPKTFPLLNLFFNRKQQDILQHNYRKNYEEIADKLMKY